VSVVTNPVVYTSESLGLRSDLQAVLDRAQKQARVASDYRAWKSRTAPDKMDRVWANYLDMVSLVQRAPFPPKRTARSWDVRTGRVLKGIPAESVLTFVGRDPEKFTRSDRVQW
jgi:hypothetical protein